MLQEVEALLGLKAGAVAVDGTLGLGGHAAMMAGRIGTEGRLIGIDQDAAAIKIARAGLSGFKGRLDIVKSTFSRLDEVLAGLDAGAVMQPVRIALTGATVSEPVNELLVVVGIQRWRNVCQAASMNFPLSISSWMMRWATGGMPRSLCSSR